MPVPQKKTPRRTPLLFPDEKGTERRLTIDPIPIILIVALLIIVVIYYRILNAIRRDIKSELKTLRELISKGKSDKRR